MKNSENEDSDFLKDKLFNYEEPAGENAWNRLKNDLDKKDRKRGFWWWLLPVILVFSSGGIWLATKSSRLETATENIVANQNKVEVPQENHFEKKDDQRLPEVKKVQKEATENSAEAKPKTANEASQSTENESLTPSEKEIQPQEKLGKPEQSEDNKKEVKPGLKTKEFSPSIISSENEIAKRNENRNDNSKRTNRYLDSKPSKANLLHSDEALRVKNSESFQKKSNVEMNENDIQKQSNQSHIIDDEKAIESSGKTEKQAELLEKPVPGGAKVAAISPDRKIVEKSAFPTIDSMNTNSQKVAAKLAVAKVDGISKVVAKTDSNKNQLKGKRFQFSVHLGALGVLQQATLAYQVPEYDGKTRETVSKTRNSPMVDVSVFGNVKLGASFRFRLGVGLAYWRQMADIRQKSGLRSDVQFQTSVNMPGFFSATPTVDQTVASTRKQDWMMPWMMPQLEFIFRQSSPFGIRAGLQICYMNSLNAVGEENASSNLNLAGAYGVFFRKSRWELELKAIQQNQKQFAIPQIEEAKASNFWIGLVGGYWF